MNMVELRPMDYPPPANWNHGVWRPDLAAKDELCAVPLTHRAATTAAMKQGFGGWKGNNFGGTHQRQNIANANSRRFYSRKKFGSRFAPFAPRNTTSFIIRAKRSGGIASLVSPPCSVTPAVLKTPVFSPLTEVVVDMAKEEWGVDGYGSMKGLIRLKAGASDEDEELSGCVDDLSDNDVVEDHFEVERRPDLDLSRFELIYPTVCEVVKNISSCGNVILESRLNYQEMQLAQLEEEKLMMNERLSRMEREMEDLRQRIQCLETYAGVMALEGSDSDMKGRCCYSEKSIGNDYDDAGLSVALRDAGTS
ncbi:hypothetical protein QQ045_027711 [Rhodiola kirilowii]